MSFKRLNHALLRRSLFVLIAMALLALPVAPAFTQTVTANPDTYSILAGSPATVDAAQGVLINDTPIGGLTASEVTPPTGGTLTLQPSGGFIYTPNVGTTTDSFTYRATDGSGNFADTTVTIEVAAAPTANNDTYNTNYDTTLTVPAATGLLSNDSLNGATGPLVVVTSPLPTLTEPSAGTLTLNSDGSFTFDPSPTFANDVQFTYEVRRGLNATATAVVTINVVPVNPQAVPDTYNIPTVGGSLTVPAPGLLANDLVGAPNSTLSVDITTVTTPLANGSPAGIVVPNANGSFTFAPLVGVSGTVTFSYQVRRSPDNVLSPPATVTITLAAPTNTPSPTSTAGPTATVSIVAQNDTYNVGANVVFTASAPGVLINDTSTQTGALTASLVSPVTGGTLILNPDGSFTYTPPTGFTGLVTFQYRATQGSFQSNIATVTINIGGIFTTATAGAITTLTPAPTVIPTLIPLFIPGPTPAPQPVPNAGQSGPLPVSDVRVVVNRDGVNVRLVPAIGAEVIGFVNAGYTAQVRAKTADNQWVRIEFSGEEGWIGFPVITVLSGNLDLVPVEDPRSIPYGGFESPRSGLTSRTSDITGILRNSGVRVRSGPSRAYVVLGNAPRGTQFSILGRTNNNAWFQVNFNGVLGWVIAREVELQNANYTDLPIDGIVADALPLSTATDANFIGTLQLLLDRLNLAQASLDEVRRRWTDASIGGELACGNYPARPTGYAVSNPLAAVYYETLVPLVTDFNSAMASVRVVVDLLLDACTNGSPVVGQPQIQIALQAIAAADGLFATVRGRLTQLIPPDRELGPEDCPFTFAQQTAILPRLLQGQLAVIQFNARNFVVGFCVDAAAGQQLRVEVLSFRGNARPVVSISPYDNPTNFIGVGRAGGENELITVGPVTIDRTAVYLVVISDLGEDLAQPLDAQVALLITSVSGTAAGFTGAGLSIDPVTGQLIANPNPSLNLPTADPNLVLTPGAVGTAPGFGSPSS